MGIKIVAFEEYEKTASEYALWQSTDWKSVSAEFLDDLAKAVESCGLAFYLVETEDDTYIWRIGE